MSRRSRQALARSAGAERGVVAMVGLVLLAAGALGALVGLSVFGTPRSDRPLLDPAALDVLLAHPVLARLAAVAAGLVLVVLGLIWVVRALRPEHRPDLLLRSGSGGSLRVTAAATADAVARDAEHLDGVGRARARMVGRPSAPALRMTLWLGDGADVRTIWRELEDGVLSRLRSSLGLESLPTAIRLELDRSVDRTRVS